MSKAQTSAFLLPHLALLDIVGPDSQKFLQGQVTCDVQKEAGNRQLTHGAHCTHKGRMIANFDLLGLDNNHLRLRLPSDNIASLQASLAKYIVFSKAELSQPEHTLIGLIGEQALAHISELAGTQISADTPVTQLGDDTVIVHSDARIELWLSEDSPIAEQLTPTDTPDGLNDWLLSEVASGKGWITAATHDQFLPQMLNLQEDAIGGISFTKGCYTGQEIVARMHYKGKMKRHMYLLENQTGEQALTAADLYSLGNGEKAGSSIGQIINLAQQAQGQLLLACATRDAIEGKGVFLDPAGQHKLTLQPLPYAITNDD